MAITSEDRSRVSHRYHSSPFLYAMVYVAVTLAALVFLNFYCFRVGERLIYRSKEYSFLEKCQLACDELSQLDVLTPAAVSRSLGQLESLTASRLIVTDKSATGLYDSAASAVGKRILLPEVLLALDGENHFNGSYLRKIVLCRCAAPIYRDGQIVGSVYMTEYDPIRGALIHSLRVHIFQITAGLEIAVVVFSLFYSGRLSRKMGRIMDSVRIIQSGDYSHKVVTSGNDELALLGREINDLTDRLQLSEAMRSRFVSDASHEIKTPLASIKLLTDSILQNDMDKDTMLEFVADIGSEAERLNRMTEKLLALTRIDSQPGGEQEILPIRPTIQQIWRMLTPTAQAAGVSMELDLRDACPILIEEDDLYQIVFNLMENGIKYNVRGGVLRVCLQREADNAVLTVEDTGQGIPADALAHIFDRFYRVDKSRSRATGGSGLGLSIVHALVQSSGGTICVASEVGKGSRFTITFPLFDTEAVQ